MIPLLRCYDGTIWKMGVPDCFDTQGHRIYDATMLQWDTYFYGRDAHIRDMHIHWTERVYTRTYGYLMLWNCGSCGLGSWLEFSLCTAHGYFALVCVGMQYA